MQHASVSGCEREVPIPTSSISSQAEQAGQSGSRSRSLRGGTRLVLVVVGTRPECIKLAPVIESLAGHPDLSVVVANSGQHRDAVWKGLATFGIRCDIDVATGQGAPNLRFACAHMTGQLREVIGRLRPDMVVVQGDTLTAFAGARAGRASGSQVAHVEAGLRTESVMDPFPEEWFRRRIARLADLHFAPSRSAVMHLRREGVDPEAIHFVGNTAIDTLRALLEREPLPASPAANRILVTLHRRENWDHNADVVCAALLELVARRPGLSVQLPVHPNPRIANRLRHRLGSHPSFALVAPMPYAEFIRAAAGAALVISDSGGVQEEAPHLGVPLLVPRVNTERTESLETGFVRLVAIDHRQLVDGALAMLDAPRRAPLPFDTAAPYGAGDAGQKIAAVLARTLRADAGALAEA